MADHDLVYHRYNILFKFTRFMERTPPERLAGLDW